MAGGKAGGMGSGGGELGYLVRIFLFPSLSFGWSCFRFIPLHCFSYLAKSFIIGLRYVLLYCDHCVYLFLYTRFRSFVWRMGEEGVLGGGGCGGEEGGY